METPVWLWSAGSVYVLQGLRGEDTLTSTKATPAIAEWREIKNSQRMQS